MPLSCVLVKGVLKDFKHGTVLIKKAVTVGYVHTKERGLHSRESSCKPITVQAIVMMLLILEVIILASALLPTTTALLL
jgi:hypothetical protein